MILKDVVYGKEEINEQVLIDIINSKTIQRLKGISQQGMPQEYYHNKICSRYDHSIGVFILLRRLGADLNEQIAGLLHDASHMAFSHVFDWVIGNYVKEDCQDNMHVDFIKNSDIPNILNKYGINYEDISCIENFSLLEQEIPNLCADRIDYAFREIINDKGKKIVDLIVSNLTNKNGCILFKSKESAEVFAKEFARLNREHWTKQDTKARYFLLSDILKKAMNKGIISIGDFKKTDKEVIDLLKKSHDKEALEVLSMLKKGFKIENVKNGGIELKKKFRYVDPGILIDGKNIKLSELSQDYKKLLDKEKQDSKFIERIKIIKN